MAFKEEGNSPSRMEYSKKRVSDLLSLLERKPGCALELGSGPGLDAINMNLLGVEVDALEIVSDLVNHGKKIQDKYHSKVNFIEMDFMKYEPIRKYDLIYYLDGFGVSTYEDQVLLLHNISKWLKLDGLCVIEVYNPVYWKKVDRRSMKLSEDLSRKYSFDSKTNSFMDTWTSHSDQTSYTQVLQCYSPEEMKGMLGQRDMKIVSIHPGGAMDFEKWEYNPRVSLEECLNYQIVFSKLVF